MNADKKEIERALSLLFEPGDVVELRIPSRKILGYFNDFNRLCLEAMKYSGEADGVYVTLNKVDPSLLARAVNKMRPAKTATSDKDIIRRRWLPIDVDPIRPAEISSTEEQHSMAIERAKKIRAYLSEWPLPILADSGNGGHLLYKIDLPNDESSRQLIEAILKKLDLLFSDEFIKVDPGNFNASRIWKLYGTMAHKGDHTPERPHRIAKIQREIQ